MPPEGLEVLLELSGRCWDENDVYLICDHGFYIGSWIKPTRKEGFWDIESEYELWDLKVHAWMPLPEHFQPQEMFGEPDDDLMNHSMFEDDPEWLYKGDCVYEQMNLEDFMNQSPKPKLKQNDVLGIMDYIREYRQQCEDDCKGIERCERCNQMLFDEIEAIVRRKLDD
jgi:hypothetical protein